MDSVHSIMHPFCAKFFSCNIIIINGKVVSFMPPAFCEKIDAEIRNTKDYKAYTRDRQFQMYQ